MGEYEEVSIGGKPSHLQSKASKMQPGKSGLALPERRAGVGCRRGERRPKEYAAYAVSK